MPSFTIAKAEVGDIPVIIQLQQQTWEPTYREILSKAQIDYMFDSIYSPEALESSMIDSGHQYMILKDGEKPCGFASISESRPHVFKLHKIYVLPSTQGTGAGKFLITAMEKLSQNLGAAYIYLNVNRYNKALSFYEKMGYAKIKEEDVAFGPYWMNDFVMEKQLIN